MFFPNIRIICQIDSSYATKYYNDNVCNHYVVIGGLADEKTVIF